MFCKEIDKRYREVMTAFLKKHFRYYTMNSWNRSTSYANCIKLYNIDKPDDVDNDTWWEMLWITEWQEKMSDLLEDFGRKCNWQWQAGINGRSGGYVVLYRGGINPSGYKSYCTHCGQKNYQAVPKGEKGICGRCDAKTRINFKQTHMQVFTWPSKDVDMYEDFEGWWVGWYESGKRKAKALPTKALAEHYYRIKYSQLNSDFFTGTVTVDWNQMVEEYRHSKRVAGLIEASLYEIALTLRNFKRLVGKCNSKQITQNTIDNFILERGKEVKRTTLNKDIRNLITFINWCRKNRYLNGEIEINRLKEDERPVKFLNSIQIRELLSASKPYQTLRMRILLALGTGLRHGDIESLRVTDIDFENSYATTRSTKTRKSMGSRPVPVRIMDELKKYVSGINPEQERIFIDRFNQYRWDQIRKKLGLGDFKFHDLRKTFGSVLAQNGVSTAVTQKLLEHSSPDLTNKVYTNVDPVLRHAVEQIPVSDWL